ncbi:MAG: Coenzyme F420 hydrogenase/dehydrogenase, beta subunit C-terminal domain, partial [Nitrososphaerota archaeon]|nr:Coenzyme F420 hydrogenase/dehydrogenase, beta subunit C-terminal domain [Nitrososphaerota archaeon]
LRHSQTGETADFDFTTWFRKKVVFTVGLFCSEVFTNKGLDDLSMKTGVPLSEMANLNVKGKIILRSKD